MARARTLFLPALRHYAFWAADMGVAVAGFVWGFGLTVQNWPALLGLMLGLRWVVCVISGTYALHVQQRDAARDESYVHKIGGSE